MMDSADIDVVTAARDYFVVAKMLRKMAEEKEAEGRKLLSGALGTVVGSVSSVTGNVSTIDMASSPPEAATPALPTMCCVVFPDGTRKEMTIEHAKKRVVEVAQSVEQIREHLAPPWKYGRPTITCGDGRIITTAEVTL